MNNVYLSSCYFPDYPVDRFSNRMICPMLCIVLDRCVCVMLSWIIAIIFISDAFCMYFNIYFLIFLCTLFTHMLLKNERMHFLYIDLSQCTFCQRFRWFVKWPAICCPLFFGNFFVSFYMSRFLFSWTLFLIFFFVNFCNLCIIFQVKLNLLHSSKANSFISLKRLLINHKN